MAAIDPTAEPEHTGSVNGDVIPRATLKLIYDRSDPDDNDDSEDEAEASGELLKTLMGRGSDEEDEDEEDDSSSDDEEVNGGPSDPAKSKKARKQAAAEQLMKALQENDESDDDMELDGLNGSLSKRKNKGKGRAMSAADEQDSDEEEDGDHDDDMEEVVVCTLDPQKPLDLVIGENQRAFFKVTGTHAIYLTGNYVIPAEGGHGHSSDDDMDEEDFYNLPPDEDELDAEDESDELDDLEDPRITEIDSDEDKAPKLVKKDVAPQKGKNKRPAEDPEEEAASLDDIMAKSLKPEPLTNGETKLSKKQMKKLKNNAGKAVEAGLDNKNVTKDGPPAKDSPTAKTDKKVQFAENLEQGPSKNSGNSKVDAKAGAKESKTANKDSSKTSGENTQPSLGVKTLQGGVKIDDRKLGTGPACKKGNKVEMRYIGKLTDGKVFDANKSGAPFKFTLGKGEVIKGWDIGVAGMAVGGERRVEVPANLAYGSKSQPGIPANSPLRFDVKMLRFT
ncbi:MAG: hypothetical protein Q9174_002866 [Haloplaca sp. 1 TL-2023]